MLTVSKLTKRYDNIIAVNNMSFEVKPGEIAILLGLNGAGKSTTIKSIAGLLKYNGEIKICGYNNKSVDAKKVFGYVPETPAVYESLTVWEHIEFIARAYSITDWQSSAETIVQRFDLADKKEKLGKELSKGMQQKLSIACALVINPKVIMFDEPMIGLDPRAIKELKNVLVELRNMNCTILISTHIIDSIEEIWDRVLIINKGEIILSRTKKELEDKDESLEKIFFDVTGDEVK